MLCLPQDKLNICPLICLPPPAPLPEMASNLESRMVTQSVDNSIQSICKHAPAYNSKPTNRDVFGGGRGWHKAWVSVCLHLVAPIGLSPLLILTLCGPERVLVVSTEPLDDLSCLTTPGSAVAEMGCCPCR